MDQVFDQTYQFFDIAANLSDNQFQGEYFGKKYHDSDINDVINRSYKIGCYHLLVASGCLSDLVHSLQICQLSNNFYTTAGIHPCRAYEPKQSGDPQGYWRLLESHIEEGINSKKIIAIGECGLDYDRLNYASKEDQLQIFPEHFNLAQKWNLPLYLHNRNTGDDFFQIVEQNRSKFSSGIVHSFTGTAEELEKSLKLDLYIGINGCSLKTEDNLKVFIIYNLRFEKLKVACMIPLNRLMLETDSPYCEVRNTHASSKYVETKFKNVKHEKFKKDSMVKSRNEPCTIVQILEIMAKLRNIDKQELAKICFENTIKFFKLR